MMSNLDLYEKSVASRRAQIQHEMQKAHVYARASQPRTVVRSAVGSIGKALVVLGSYLEQIGQQKKASLHTS